MNARRERPPNDEDVLVFAGSGSVRLTDAICTELGVARGRGETIRFSEGTLFVRVLENVRGRAVYIVQSTASWLNLVERWFAELTTKWIKRGTHRSVRDLVASIRTWIANWNDDPKPFVWHKSADEILDSLAAYCQRINDSGH